MDPTVLVREQIQAGARLARDLILNDFPITDAAWVRFEDEGWTLEFVTPLVESIGRRRTLIRLLEIEGPDRHPEVNFDQIRLIAPHEARRYGNDIGESIRSDALASPAVTGLGVAGSPIERYTYNREPLFYEARIAQELRRLFSRENVDVDPRTNPEVDVLVRNGESLFAVEIKSIRRQVDTSEVLQMLGVSTVLSLPVVLVTPAETSTAAAKLAGDHADRLRLVTWETDDDTPKLGGAFAEPHPS